MKHRRILIILVLLFSSLFALQAQDWVIGEDQSNLSIPDFSSESISKGKEIFYLNCKACHGDPGKNNFNAALIPPPPDITSEQMQKNSDGLLYYKVLNGKLTMPQFKPVLSEDQIWHVISFIRSFNNEYAPEGNLITGTKLPEGNASIQISINEKEGKIYAVAYIIDSTNSQMPYKGATLNFAVKRYFGNLKFATAKTDENGQSVVNFPTEIPGDPEGKADLVVTFADGFEGISGIADQVIICSPTEPVNIFKKRVLWSENTRTQWWVILSYTLVVAGVWLTIFYVIMQIASIAKLSKQ
ncbi:c-type cytochrome [Bacteroidota bacterium]